MYYVIQSVKYTIGNVDDFNIGTSFYTFKNTIYMTLIWTTCLDKSGQGLDKFSFKNKKRRYYIILRILIP